MMSDCVTSEECVMIDRINIALTKSINVKLFEGDGSLECLPHFGEIASHLSAGEFDALMNDLDAYDSVGLVTARVADMKRRARCMADADRIIARLDRDIADLAA